MNERTAVYGAVAVGVAAMATLFVLSRRSEGLAPKIVGQTVLGGTDTLPSRVQIEIEPPVGLRRLSAGDETWEYRVTDAEGRIYLKREHVDDKLRTLIVPTTYGRPAIEPRLEVWTNGKKAASAPLSAWPSPSVEPMEAKLDARLRAYHASDGLPKRAGHAWGWIRYVPLAPLKPDEFWTYDLLGTPLQRHLYRDRAFVPLNREAAVQLLYADDVESINVRVHRWIAREQTAWVTTPELRLVKKKGETVLELGEYGIPNDLGLNVRLRLWELPHGFQSDRGSDGDDRTPELDMMVSPLPGTLKPTYRYLKTSTAFDDASLNRLNLLGLRVGTAFWTAKDRHPGPVERRPFSLRLKLTKHWAEPAGSFETTIPVEPAPAVSEKVSARE